MRLLALTELLDPLVLPFNFLLKLVDSSLKLQKTREISSLEGLSPVTARLLVMTEEPSGRTR